MPNGDNWQGDVLRDLRGASGPPAAGTGGPPASVPPAPPTAAQASATERIPGPTQPPVPAPTPTPAPAPQQAPALQQAPTPQQTPAPPRPRRPSAPDSRAVVDSVLSGTARRPQRGEPVAVRVTRAVRRIVSSSAAREVAELTRTAEALQQPVTTGRQIAVTSIRGGAGKTTVAALLGTAYAHYRQDPVLLVEADPALGSLPLRLGAETLRWTTADLADIVEPQMSLLDVTGYLVQLPENAWLLPGSQGQIGAMLDTSAYERVMVALRRYFGVTVVDCETLPAEVARVALSASQARVLAAPATLDGVTSTYAVLQWMQGLPRHMIDGTVVVLSSTVARPGIDVEAAAEKLRSTGAGVHVLPYDRHLAAGGVLRTELLGRPTRLAATRLAAEVFQLSQKRR
ncbi:MinD/ParA family protein [Streptomyces sp. ME02-6991-2A]|uniref:MinD/ParA family ATP-binding protein n=1 Tax=Streptomyces sp. ME02-6991-2A TaxID=3028677 RepID=UPI0029A54D08|nr:MinD/ParA family protein [Streptomyces sp. ME02-6991-2A]MDX3375048.1 MinD/ParA family protein [Streptomyces sp. ME02-6991-2A]